MMLTILFGFTPEFSETSFRQNITSLSLTQYELLLATKMLKMHALHSETQKPEDTSPQSKQFYHQGGKADGT